MCAAAVASEQMGERKEEAEMKEEGECGRLLKRELVIHVSGSGRVAERTE